MYRCLRDEGFLRLIIDSSSLIVLARLVALRPLHDVYGIIAFTASVCEEVVIQGQKKRVPDASIVDKAVRDGWLHELSLTAAEKRFAAAILRKTSGVSRTDAET